MVNVNQPSALATGAAMLMAPSVRFSALSIRSERRWRGALVAPGVAAFVLRDRSAFRQPATREGR
jgi:hypothetical protein